MRSINTLYKIAYGRIMWANDNDYAGMCHIFHTLVRDKLITPEEGHRLRHHLDMNRPNERRHIEFAIKKSYDAEDFYWFPPGELKLRKKFLKKMINYTKPWYIRLYLLWKGKL